ncbi:uncharacterized protein LOC117175054 [Belonocnema kinseyi]|uniref:uncharacterized protein LOC117175054 n=1 Tax=Belonocnema kinseyi TaxID=2817044 RepID=UPI00143D78A0|nr:uncharacterized protein LOC117175054 [Belonocnema kinseyi]
MTEKSETSEKLKNLECPFTWKLNEIYKIVKEHKESQTHDDENLVPILKFMRLVVNIYESVLKEDFTKVHEWLKLAEQIFDEMKKDEDIQYISLEVLENILNGTKCHLEMQLKNFKKVEESLKTIKKIDYSTNPKARSTLNGCKSLAWSKYKESGERGIRNAIDFASLAIRDNPKFAAWHFIQGINLRRQRKGPQYYSLPCKEEIEAFKKAYELSQKHIYGIRMALIYKEQKDYPRALSIYEQIYNTNPQSCTIQLRLALGFIRSRGERELLFAKKCLDFVEERSPEDCMYLHYRGVYLQSLRKFDEAADYYLKASKDFNYCAEMSFLRCKHKQKVNYDFINHLQKMIEKYESTDERRELDLLLHLAACFFILNKDIPNAVKYYLKAFEKDPESDLFKKHPFILSSESINVYVFLKYTFFPAVEQERDLDFSTKEACLKLKKYCDDDVLKVVKNLQGLKLF